MAERPIRLRRVLARSCVRRHQAAPRGGARRLARGPPRLARSRGGGRWLRGGGRRLLRPGRALGRGRLRLGARLRVWEHPGLEHPRRSRPRRVVARRGNGRRRDRADRLGGRSGGVRPAGLAIAARRRRAGGVPRRCCGAVAGRLPAPPAPRSRDPRPGLRLVRRPGRRRRRLGLAGRGLAAGGRSGGPSSGSSRSSTPATPRRRPRDGSSRRRCSRSA